MGRGLVKDGRKEMKRGFFVFLTIIVICLLAGVSSVLAAWRYVKSEGESTSSILVPGTRSPQSHDAVGDGKDRDVIKTFFRNLSKRLECRWFLPGYGNVSYRLKYN